MTLEFPRLVFKNIGVNPRAGGTYSGELVQNKEEYDAAIKAGWFNTLSEAIEPAKLEEKKSIDDLEPAAIATLGDRTELEKKASELGLKVRPAQKNNQKHQKD